MITVTESLLEVVRLCAFKTHADFNCPMYVKTNFMVLALFRLLALNFPLSHDCSKRLKLNVRYWSIIYDVIIFVCN